jgi:hypothetical protein
VISETFAIYRDNVGPLLGTALLVFIVAGLIQGVLAATDSPALIAVGTVAVLAGETLFTGFVVKLVADVRDGRRDFTVGELFRSGSRAFWPLIANGLLKAIAVTAGLILLIVPGLILLTIWAVTAPAIVVEREGILGAFGRSQDLVSGAAWRVFGVILVVFLITIAISIVFAAVGAPTGDFGQVLLAIAGNIIAAPIAALASSILFFDLGGGTDAAAPAEPASVA